MTSSFFQQFALYFDHHYELEQLVSLMSPDMAQIFLMIGSNSRLLATRCLLVITIEVCMVARDLAFGQLLPGNEPGNSHL
ncbi:jg15721 [Pararge aegeria aegeria]|uniref:Jg15721 protein n=1 Tax=Pararge aegeria aegeria TaxID=348720 RepID=A0A8S4SKW1_9NEOP|nr:jg15721 [Pararge aegeria aegeria]